MSLPNQQKTIITVNPRFGVLGASVPGADGERGRVHAPRDRGQLLPALPYQQDGGPQGRSN